MYEACDGECKATERREAHARALSAARDEVVRAVDRRRPVAESASAAAARDEVVRAAQAYAKATASFRDVFEERMRLFGAVAALARLEKP